MSNVLEISDSSFAAEVLQSSVPVLVDFWAPWCGPCKAIAPVVDELATKYSGRLKVVKVNVDNHKEAAMKYNVRSIPNLILFKNGESQEQIVGAVAKQELINAIEKLVQPELKVTIPDLAMSTLVNTVSKQVNLNGEQKSVHSSTVAELLAELGLAHKKLAVELNRKIVSRDSFTSTLIAEGDVIEIIDFVGGG